MAYFPKWEFFSESLLMCLVSFIHAYLHAKNQSQIFISEISTIKEYWNLIGREQFLAITWEPDFSQACNFRKMLMNHKNFCFTYIPDKTNDMIFLSKKKKSKNPVFGPFLTIFGHLCPMEIFSKKSGSVTRNHAKLQKKLMSQFWGNLRTDGRTIFYRTLPAEAGGSKSKTNLLSSTKIY